MLTDPSNELEELYMDYTKLSSRGVRELFAAVKDNEKLKKLDIEGNAITDDACDVVTTALERNSCLVELRMYDNPLSSEAKMHIAQCLKANNTLRFLRLPHCRQGVQENIRSLQEVFNNKREIRGCQVVLKIVFYYY